MTDNRLSVRPQVAHTYLPPQHGAWAFLALPLVLGSLLAPVAPVLVLLGVAWIAAYPWSYALLGLAGARRPQRFLRPAAVWSLVVVPAAVILVALQPWLLLVGLLYLLLFAINLVHARRRDERAIVNDLVLIAECAAMVPVVWAVGAAAGSASSVPDVPVPESVWILTAVCAFVLIGSTLHVKSLIRERADPRFARASKAFAVACVPLSIALAAAWGLPSGMWLVVPFIVLALRDLRPASASQRPGTIGLIELGCFIVTASAAALAVA